MAWVLFPTLSPTGTGAYPMDARAPFLRDKVDWSTKAAIQLHVALRFIKYRNNCFTVSII
jgi:hypothetical protein